MTSLTSAERALELFQRREPGEDRIDRLANQLLSLAAECRFLSFRVVPVGEGKWTFECSDSAHTVASDDPGPLRIFRTLLARYAKKAVEETGAEFQPYGGNLHFDRDTPAGPTRIAVEFRNTTTANTLTLTRLAG